MLWSVTYERAIRNDGSLFFPQRLTHEFLDSARRTMGSYIFANQYQNEIVPLDEMIFKPEWVKYYTQIPKRVHTYAFIDPAISLENTADYTGVSIVDVDSEGTWYVKYCKRSRLTPTQLIELLFKIYEVFKPQCIGIEQVAFQRALLYMADSEMRRRGVMIPVKGVSPDTTKTKEIRIQSLVPRFEWGRIFLAQGLKDLEDELRTFPRSAHDDLLDSLSSIEAIVSIPTKETFKDEQPHPTDAANYESWYRRNIDKVRPKEIEE